MGKRYESRNYDTETWDYRTDMRAAVLLERQAQAPPPACCCDRIADGWFDAGCRLHRPVRSFEVTGWRA